MSRPWWRGTTRTWYVATAWLRFLGEVWVELQTAAMGLSQCWKWCPRKQTNLEVTIKMSNYLFKKAKCHWQMHFYAPRKIFWGAYSHRVVCAYVPNSCPAHNFVIWSWILKLFHRNDHNIKTMCCAQHLGRYLEGQSHSMTMQQNRVRPINFFIISWILKLFHSNDHHIETTYHTQHLGCYLEGQGHSMTLQHNGVWHITLLFEVGFQNDFKE